MLANPKLKTFHTLVHGSSKEELIWMNGFLSALLLPEPGESIEPLFKNQPPALLSSFTVVYGTETGNSKKVALDFSSRLKKQQIPSKIKSLDQYRLSDLSSESNLLIVMSTQGDGEPPETAKQFYDYIHQNDVSLTNLKYGVFALGDSAYPLFCQAGVDVDNRLSQLGAQRMTAIKKCDVDFENNAVEWIDTLIDDSILSKGKTASANITAIQPLAEIKSIKQERKIYTGKITFSINLNDKNSEKETRHIEILCNETIKYEPGNAIGIVAKNDQAAVNNIFELLKLSGSEVLVYKSEQYTALKLFTEKITIQYLPARVVQLYGKMVEKEIPLIRMDLVDLLRIYPAEKKLNVQELVSILTPVIPRLYSVSSSPTAHGENEIHLTVSLDTFNVDGHLRNGLCSGYLSGLEKGTLIQFYVQKNNGFKLPADDSDIIMIGPGTGIAPFRSFLFEREAKAAPGRNWLFFGEQYFVSDFLYQTDIQIFFETRVLTKLNTAFSRDQEEKIYVQHKMKQHANELFAWIENGAIVFISGAKEPMSVEVEQTLIEIISEQKSIDQHIAAKYLTSLKNEGRYYKDVY